jgi:twinkle protein
MGDSRVERRERCPKCAANGHDAAGNNLAVYDDGHAYCFREGCDYFRRGDGKVSDSTAVKKAEGFTPLGMRYVELPERKLTEKTTRLFGYGVGKFANETVQIACFRKDDVLVAQHIRMPTVIDPDTGEPKKSFPWNGDYNGVELFGQHLWKSGGRTLIITEGEIDAMTVSQVMDHRWPVVSIPNGTKAAVKDIKNNLEFVASFQEIILMFDNDAAGRSAAHKVADILPPGRVRIATLPYKDANDALLKGDTAAIQQARWNAAVYSPDEILHASAVISAGPEVPTEQRVWSYPHDSMTERLIGRRSGEIVMLGSGTGSGKSTMLREWMISDLLEGRKVGAIMLEESPEETIDDLVSLMLSKPVRKIKAMRLMNRLRLQMNKEPIKSEIVDDLTDAEYIEAKQRLARMPLYLYDHLGNTGMRNLMARMEFMAVSLGVDVLYLDHITAAANGIMAANQQEDGNGNSVLVIDSIMGEIRSLVARTGVHIDIVSQLKKGAKAFEEGDRITLQDFRGSGSLTSVPNAVIALERDRQSADTRRRNTTEVRLLKDRLTGRSGVVAALYYDEASGRMEDVPFSVDDDGNVLLDPAFDIQENGFNETGF